MSEWDNNVHGTSFFNGSYLRVIDTDGYSSGNYYLDMFRLNDKSFESSDPTSTAWSTEAVDALGGIDPGTLNFTIEGDSGDSDTGDGGGDGGQDEIKISNLSL